MNLIQRLMGLMLGVMFVATLAACGGGGGGGSSGGGGGAPLTSLPGHCRVALWVWPTV